MTESKHTPGPWHWEWDEDTGEPRVYAMQRENKLRDRLVCVVGHYGDDPDMGANAALIAAAPGLYDALSTLIANVSDVDYHPDSIFAHFVENARAALAKAEGAPA